MDPNHKSKKNDHEEKQIKMKNIYLEKLKEDVLYHLALGTHTHDLKRMFGDVKFICMGGTAQRMKTFAHFIKNEIGYHLPIGSELIDLCENSQRFALYKIGPILSVSHGMGIGSVSILLHEMLKLTYYAECKDPIFIRIGTSGGIDVEPGTVVISDGAVNGFLEDVHEFTILGKRVQRKAHLDKNLAQKILSFSRPNDKFKTITGISMATDDFYEAQGRLDGAICEYTKEEKFNYLQKVHKIGVRNIEMECTVFAALTHNIGVQAAIVCVTLLNRLKGDQIATSKDEIVQWQLRPQVLVGRFIKNYLMKQ